MRMQTKKCRCRYRLYIVVEVWRNGTYCVLEENRKKSKKTLKKVLTKRLPHGIIVKRSRETAKNEKPKGWTERAWESAKDLEN